jgi:hypothetical protein
MGTSVAQENANEIHSKYMIFIAFLRHFASGQLYSKEEKLNRGEISQRNQTVLGVSRIEREKDMAKQNPTTHARISIPVVALFAIAWSWPAFGQGPVSLAKNLSKGGPYHVFLSQNPRKEHQEAIVAVVQTSKDPNAPPALVFLQTKERGHIGKGMVCVEAKEREDSALECHQTVGDKIETLRVGAIGSKFCNHLKDQIDACVKQNSNARQDLYTSDDKNPIATSDECTNDAHPKRECVCYEINHGGPVCSLGAAFPPNSGTGTGGHN